MTAAEDPRSRAKDPLDAELAEEDAVLDELHIVGDYELLEEYHSRVKRGEWEVTDLQLKLLARWCHFTAEDFRRCGDDLDRMLEEREKAAQATAAAR